MEAVTTTGAERAALARPDEPKRVEASALRRWLEQVYPPAIMDSSGAPPAVSGRRTLAPAGAEGRRRFATLKCEVTFELDDKAKTVYRGTLEAVVEHDGDGPDFRSFRGVGKGCYPKTDARRGRTTVFDMTAVIESVE